MPKSVRASDEKEASDEKSQTASVKILLRSNVICLAHLAAAKMGTRSCRGAARLVREEQRSLASGGRWNVELKRSSVASIGVAARWSHRGFEISEDESRSTLQGSTTYADHDSSPGCTRAGVGFERAFAQRGDAMGKLGAKERTDAGFGSAGRVRPHALITVTVFHSPESAHAAIAISVSERHGWPASGSS